MHRVERSKSSVTRTSAISDILSKLLPKLVEIDFFKKLYEKLARLTSKSAISRFSSKGSAHRLREPPPTTNFEPAKVPAERSGA